MNLLRKGIIPASAGNTLMLHSRNLQDKDHPRIRGEHAIVTNGYAKLWGSSPHPRGTQGRKSTIWFCAGIIPASAGNTLANGMGVSLNEDHPRIRGEHSATRATQDEGGGSSPHPRGTLVSGERMNCDLGIIPASAGNTGSTSQTQGGSKDHPRIRGEHQQDDQSRLAYRRIIPASAGNTLKCFHR